MGVNDPVEAARTAFISYRAYTDVIVTAIKGKGDFITYKISLYAIAFTRAIRCSLQLAPPITPPMYTISHIPAIFRRELNDVMLITDDVGRIHIYQSGLAEPVRQVRRLPDQLQHELYVL